MLQDKRTDVPKVFPLVDSKHSKGSTVSSSSDDHERLEQPSRLDFQSAGHPPRRTGMLLLFTTLAAHSSVCTCLGKQFEQLHLCLTQQIII